MGSSIFIFFFVGWDRSNLRHQIYSALFVSTELRKGKILQFKQNFIFQAIIIKGEYIKRVDNLRKENDRYSDKIYQENFKTGYLLLPFLNYTSLPHLISGKQQIGRDIFLINS